MWTTIIIVILAVSMMLGPIMLIQPSKRQRRLAKLRAAATQNGLRVRMSPLPPKSKRAGESVAVYFRSWEDPKKRRKTWMLARQSIDHGVHFADDWDWVDDRRPTQLDELALKAALADLPESVLGLEATGQTLGLYWLENLSGKSEDEAVSEIASWLGRLHRLLA